jgi:hypothetical protein
VEIHVKYFLFRPSSAPNALFHSLFASFQRVAKHSNGKMVVGNKETAMTQAQRKAIHARLVAHGTTRADGTHKVYLSCRCSQCNDLRARLFAALPSEPRKSSDGVRND